jgi:hypothetical protein
VSYFHLRPLHEFATYFYGVGVAQADYEDIKRGVGYLVWTPSYGPRLYSFAGSWSDWRESVPRLQAVRRTIMATNGRTVAVFGRTGFLGRHIGICALADFRLDREDIRIRGRDCLALMIRNFTWRPIFKTSRQSRMHLPVLTAL